MDFLEIAALLCYNKDVYGHLCPKTLESGKGGMKNESGTYTEYTPK